LREKMPRFLQARAPNSNNLFTILKTHFMFPRNDFHWRFYSLDRQWKAISTLGFLSSTTNKNRFSLAVFLATYINNFFY
jgi:hypothetical protein